MKRVVVISALAYAFFLAEFVLYNTFGRWGKPEFLVLLVVFCNLYWGIRYSIIAAFICGILKDAFGVEPFGTFLFIYAVAAYLTTFIRRNLYQPGSRVSRVMVACLVVVGCFLISLFAHSLQHEVRLTEALTFILMPQLVTTVIVATIVFHRLRDLVVRFKI